MNNYQSSSLFYSIKSVTLVFLGISLIAGCSKPGGGDTGITTSNEPAYYGTPTAVTNPIYVKTKALFLYRQLTFNATSQTRSSSEGLGSVVAASSGKPIPYAEFHILDSSGNRVQQGETDATGVALFQLPRQSGNFRFKVFSRSANSYLKASVLEDINSNSPYSISIDFSLNSSQVGSSTVGTSSAPLDLTGTPAIAEADENISAKIEGGAFNIHYNLYLANAYIRKEIGKDDVTKMSDPLFWWVAPKVSVYWKAGFNPATYFGSSAELSFYIASADENSRKLYILGGVSGNVKVSDTDHFDNSVILHEYGHFLENSEGRSQSPGGSHSGQARIDPRLAWSEGFADYIQAAIQSGANNVGGSPKVTSQYYIDTVGYKSTNSDNAGRVALAIDLSENGSGARYDDVTNDPNGAGSFREISISRTLFKATRASNQSLGYPTLSPKTGGGIPFEVVWKSFSGDDGRSRTATKSNPVTQSLRSSSVNPLTWMGMMNSYMTTNSTAASVSTTNYSSLLSEEKQSTGSANYGAVLAAPASNATCTVTMGVGRPDGPADYPISDQALNNKFYILNHTGSLLSLKLVYSQNSSTVMDADIILYKFDYTYFEDVERIAGRSSSDIITQGRRFRVESGGADSGIELLDLQGVPAGTYLVNVKYNSYKPSNQLKLTSEMNGGITFYFEDPTGKRLCPL